MGKKPSLSAIQRARGQIVILHKELEGLSERKISEKLSIDSFSEIFLSERPTLSVQNHDLTTLNG